LKTAFGGAFIATEGFTKVTAEAEIQSGKADAVAFGKSFIANPDLTRRLAEDAPLNEPKPALFFGSGADGYTDYPALQPE
jgi:2,4-dienoyl-CoA reductase-like NADH-dependent reductase (Old Yellow Enzyme family)